MAQIPDFLTDEKSIVGGIYTALIGASRARSIGPTIAPAAAPVVTSSGSLRTGPLRKVSGLGLGERRLLQAFADWVVLVTGSFFILGMSDRLYSRSAMGVSLLVLTALWFFFADAFDAYKVPVMQSRFYTAYAAARVAVVTTASYTLVAWFAGGTLPLIRPRISETLLIAALMLPIAGVRVLLSLALSRAPLRRRVVVVGANQDGYEMVEAFRRYDGQTYEFLGYFDDAPRVQDNVPIRPERVHPTSELVAFNELYGVDQVVLANPVQTGPLLHTISLLHEQGAQITPMFAIYQDLTGRVPVSHLGNDWYVALPANVKKTTRTYQMVKRGMDIIMSLGMLIVAAPIIPFVMLAIKLDSPGPIFFKQVRVGRGGKLFKIVKFRSMRQDAEAGSGAVWASNGDPRVTRIGRFLRKSRIDEIPQLWNIVVGDMSFVGPRPERPEFDEQLEREIPFYRARRAVRPGLTGWAQVQYRYGNTIADTLRKVEYDLYYIKNESLYLDLLILLRTVAVVLKLGGN
ncbi:MAG: sugar transferase [Chloroflexota bacterium]|nr:sugar transferase [Chloroflexota bacterium]